MSANFCAGCAHETKRPIGFWDGENGSGGFLYTCENMECPIAQRREAAKEEHIRHKAEVQEANRRKFVDAKLFRDMRRKAGVSLREAANLAGIPPVEMSAYEAERKPFSPEIYKKLMKKLSDSGID